MPVITVSRMFGSGGSEVAARVARELGWTLVDHSFIEGVAGRLGTTPAAVEAIEERAPTLAERLADALALGSGEVVSAPLSHPLRPTEERLIQVTRRLVEEAVARGPAVLVGRGAQAMLAERTDALHVLCCAPAEALAARVAQREGIGVEEAAARVRDRNHQRAEYVRRYWQREWLAPDNYHVCVNTAWLGIEGAVRVVVGRVRDSQEV
jgi:cytidylate kinase